MAEAEIQFSGHYGEPKVTVTFDTTSLTEKNYMMVFDPATRVWEEIVEV